MNKYYFSTEIATLLNPPPHSKYIEKQKDSLESLYHSRKKAPLGYAPGHDIFQKSTQKGFGVPTVKDTSAAECMYPSKNKVYNSVYSQMFTFKKMNDCIKPAGVKLKDLDNTGEQMKEIFSHKKMSSVIVPSSYVNTTNCSVKSPKENIASDCLKPKGFVRNENKSNSKGTSRTTVMDKCFVEVLWNLLKIKNHENFQDLLSSFRAYKNGNDKVNLSDLQKMCQKFGLSAPLHVLEKLIEECDTYIDKDGAVSYDEFVQSLKWKDTIPENDNFKILKNEYDWREGINNPLQEVTDIFRTTASFIGDHKYSICSRVAGLPSYNKDTDRSKLKGMSDFHEYGDASSMIQPNIFTKHGVSERDLNVLYTKEEIKQLLMKSGIKVSDAGFEIIWQNISKNGKTSIGAVWNALKKQCLLHYKYL